MDKYVIILIFLFFLCIIFFIIVVLSKCFYRNFINNIYSYYLFLNPFLLYYFYILKNQNINLNEQSDDKKNKIKDENFIFKEEKEKG